MSSFINSNNRAAGFSTRQPRMATYEDGQYDTSGEKSGYNDEHGNLADHLAKNRDTRPQSHDDMTKAASEPIWNDVWVTILYVLHFIPVGYYGVVYLIPYLQKIFSSKDETTPGTKPSNPNSGKDDIKDFINFMFYQLPIPVGISLIVNVFSLMGILNLLLHFPKQTVKGSFIAHITLSVIGGVLLAIFRQDLIGYIMLGFCLFNAVLMIIFYFLWRKFINFTAALLKTTVRIIQKARSIYWVQAVCLTFAFLYLIMISLCTTAYIMTEKPEGHRQIDNTPVHTFVQSLPALYLAFSFYWTIQLCFNIVHTVTAGVAAHYYFRTEDQFEQERPVAGAVHRTMTYSFGSVALGSLLVAIVQTMKAMVRDANNRRNRGGDILTCLIMCILNLFEDLIRFFNKYAYVQVAIYGKSFIQAAKDTWHLILKAGIDAIINDNLVDTTIGIFTFLAIIISLIIGAIYTSITLPSIGEMQAWDWIKFSIVMSVVTLITILIYGAALQPISSAVTALFVCLAMDPAAVAYTNPEFYQAIQESYGIMAV